ncbi:NAD(P)/FAD-dependent oxidoreductase [Streptomyces sp. NBC_00859]|uniref:NAD(P)/FAD-dependent oxidoreductase n=1 Tax=Streptomyces sp. NBC_00859 TaxID=2903682 RepID=UPI00386342C3|nr:FAD-binding oxidoreductase [Streptomyces sp. NBC_00859]WSZ86784.1 FAD-binding oxidoreductase [Streptomyces sp. NBC_00859]
MASKNLDVDVAVVGAGVIGCMTAREILARSPGTSVMVLDRDMTGSGATRRSAGLHFPRGAVERVRRMSAYSQDYYAKLLALHPDLPVHPLPMTVIAAEASGAALRGVYLDSAQLRRSTPDPDGRIRIPPGSAAWQGEGCQYADVHALTQFLSRRLRGPVSVRESVRVDEVRPEQDAVVLRLGTGETVTAGRAVLAPGPWLAAPAWKDLVAPLNARVKKVVAMHIGVRPGKDDHAIVLHDEDAFLLPRYNEGRWLFSYTCQEWDVDPESVADGLSRENLSEARAVLGRYAPGLVEHCVSGRVFCDAFSPGGAPLVTSLDGHGRLVFAGAANGSGYRLAPAIAAEAVGLLNLPHHGEKDQS